MDAEVLPQRPSGGRRSRTQDTRPSKVAKSVSEVYAQAQPSTEVETLPEYRSSAEQDQKFECA